MLDEPRESSLPQSASKTPSVTNCDLAIVLPIFNDWNAFALLTKQIDDTFADRDLRLYILAVDDGSNQTWDDVSFPLEWNAITAIDVLRLKRNLGHQRAIAIGLAYAEAKVRCQHVVIMDSDGEDRPADILKLIDCGQANPGSVIFAARAKRSEGPLFTLFYVLYKLVFRVLTGVSISFGNFCLVPSRQLSKLTCLSEIWNHFAAGALRSNLPLKTVRVDRGRRFIGRSKMNLTSLLTHGLSAASVFSDIIAVRLMAFSVILILLSIMGAALVVGVRFLTDLAIPGWATNVAVGLFIILLQALLLSVVLIFQILGYRTQKTFVPSEDYPAYIGDLRRLMKA